MRMKKLFLTSIAALFLATGAAHAKPAHADICQHFRVIATLGQYFHLDPIGDEGARRLQTLRVRYNFKTNQMYLNGKRCFVDDGP